MSICYWCHWGWPKPVFDIWAKAVKALADIDCNTDVLQYGPSHIVWDDENWGSAQWCLGVFDEPMYARFSKTEMDICRQSLIELAALPESIWDIEPDAYLEDDNNPHLYPPPEGVIMVTKHQMWAFEDEAYKK